MSEWFYGRNSVLEVLKSDRHVQKLLIATGVDPNSLPEIIRLAESKGVDCQRVERGMLDSQISGNHQGIAIQTGSFKAMDLKQFLEQSSSLVKSYVCLLDEIQDPQNLGAIIRSAVCLGCSGLFVSKHRAAHVTGAVMKSSSGAAAHLPVIQSSNLGVVVERLKEKNFFVYGADPSGESLSSVQFEFPLAILLGNEHRGIKPVLRKNCDKLVSIPQTSTISSLNVSSAAAVIFYEIARSQSGSREK